eukprot:TRINITY_DN10828_c0_g1_i1.p1 TRINITY_DN10828_c0_g1~~TRINITY_DN10828_c0_g1_i1.p1  ORF type:complete len:177 (+),score=54.33 TRINITY_DN10828_c0_g1_i1:25-531(+)
MDLLEVADLYEHVSTADVECLNLAPGFQASHVLTGAGVKSDCDEQLLITIPFRQPSKLHSIAFSAPDDGSGPRTVKLFVNQNSMSFEDGARTPTQEIVLTPEQLKGEVIPLRFVKFQNLSFLTLFVEDNQDGTETTTIQKIKLIGVTTKATNVSELKKMPGTDGLSAH